MYIKKIHKGWKELEEEVINTGKCTYCGACGAFCLNIQFDPKMEIPMEDGACEQMNTCREGYGVCYNLCPQVGIDQIPLFLLDQWVFEKEHKKILGHYKRITSAKVTDAGKKIIDKNAGPITAILYAAMEEGIIDASLVTGKDENFRPYPKIAEIKEDLIESIGYKPSQSPTLSKLGEAMFRNNYDIAVVGTPCQIQALRKVQNHPQFDFEAYDLVNLAIGTFCFGTFHNQQLNEIFLEYEINPAEIQKIETDKDNFKMIVSTSQGIKKIPLNKLYDNAIREACFACSDYTASFADISVGVIGVEGDWKTIIIRTEEGKGAFENALKKGYIITKELTKDNEEIVLDITRKKTDISTVESVIYHSPDIKSFLIRNERIAKAYQPGMYVILWLPDVDFLPMSVSKVKGNVLEITVEKIGEGTKALFELKEGDRIGIRGPFGNTWNYEDAQNILAVGGGMGIAAITSLIEPLKKNKKNVYVAIGAKDEASLIFEERLKDLIPETLCTTDDGSVGQKCMVTDPIEELIEKNDIDLILTCGPEVMMKRILEIAKSRDVNVQASLERKMKCGVGLCGSCCVGENNEVCVCKEGPIFLKRQLVQFPQFGTYKK
ncbi:MAG: dihydroorotate dehydrogenase electron transfer subunit [Promethearchaeia archaeon]